MPDPQPTPPHSDLTGVNRDARAGVPSRDAAPDPGAQLDRAQGQNKSRPAERGVATHGEDRQAMLDKDD